MTDLISRLAKAPIVPLVQADDPDVAIATTRALAEGGLTVIEVVLRTPSSLECMHALCELDDDLIAEANGTDYGLAAGVWTRDIGKAHSLAAKLKAGTVWVNTYNIFDAAMPFGGYKQSGWGREMGHDALDLYTQKKAVCAML